MCFSAPASFIAGTALSAIGLVALRTALTDELRLIGIASLLNVHANHNNSIEKFRYHRAQI